MDIKTALEGFFISRRADGFSESTLSMYRWALNLILGKSLTLEVNEITEKHLVDFWAWVRNDYRPKRKNGDTSPLVGRSLENIWTASRSFFGWCEGEKIVKSRPDLKIKRPQYTSVEVQPFSREEVALMLRACERTRVASTTQRTPFTSPRPTAARDTLVILVLLDTGLRVSEFARLKVSDVNLDTGAVNVRSYGSGRKTKARTVYLGKSSKKAVWRYLAGRDDVLQSDPLVLTRDNRPMDRNSIRQLLTSIGEAAGITGNTHPHRFRHTAALEYLRNGGDIFTLQRLFGWADLEMARKYLQIVGSDLESAHRKASPADNWRL